MANKEEKLKTPVVGIGTQPQYAQQPQEEIPAANVQYEPNRKRRFTVTPEGAKYGIIDINGTVGHIQQDKRPAEVQNALFDLYQEVLPNKAIDRNDPNAVSRYVTQAYNTLHKENKVDDLYVNKKLIQYEPDEQQASQPQAPVRKTPEQLQKEAAETGKSYLQLYQENMAQPEYDEKRAKTLKTNSNASIVADILKLIGEGITTKRGGTPITRQTIVPQLNAELQRLNDTYKQEVQAYKKGAFNALLMDEQEKKRAAAVEAAREAAIQQIKIKAYIEQRQREKQEQSELNKIKTKHEFDMLRDKINNEAKIKTASISASGRRENKEDEFKLVDQYVNGQVVKVPIAIVNDVAAKERKISMVNETKTENDLFNQHWNKYFDYVNGEFVPKGTAPATTTGATSRASRNNTQPKSRAK